MLGKKYLFIGAAVAVVMLSAVAGSAAALRHKSLSGHRPYHGVRTRVGGLAPTASTSHRNTCPPDPAPFSTVDGGLDVVGVCHLVHVTVNGGITVESTGHLELENSTVNGATDVLTGGELDSGHSAGGITASFAPSTFNGSVKWNQGVDLDMDGATVNGNVDLTGPNGAVPAICMTTITGKLTLDGVSAGLFGDPGEVIQVGPHPDCPGNTIGSFQARNTHAGRNVEVEMNTFTGSAQLFSSQIAFWANTVGGSLQCHDGSALSPDPDGTPNNVHGNNTCT